MQADYERFIKLAKKTGDTLIILDSEAGFHQVIMDIDRYEDLVMEDSCIGCPECDDSPEFIDRDSSAPCETDSELFDLSEKNTKKIVPPDTDFAPRKWHAAADVLDNLHPEFNVAPNDSEDMLSSTGFGFEEDIKLNFEPPQEPQFQGKFAQTQSANESVPLKYDPLMQEPQPIPLASQQEQEADIYNEESLGEEPIFFEEPLA